MRVAPGEHADVRPSTNCSPMIRTAAATAGKTARTTLRDLRVAEVVQLDIHLEEDGAITYRTKLQVSFKYETGS